MGSQSQSSVAAVLTVGGLAVLFVTLLYGLTLLSKRWKANLINRVFTAIKRRRNKNDTFRQEYGYSWDYFMAFRVYDEFDPVTELQMENNLKSILAKLAAGGLEIRMFYSLQRKEVFCKIRCPFNRLLRHADMTDYKLKFDPVKLREICTKGREGLWDGINISEESTDLTTIDPYEYIYGKYCYDADTGRTTDDLRPLYKRWPQITAESLLADHGEILSEEDRVSYKQMITNPMNPNRPIKDPESGEHKAEEVDDSVFNEARIFRSVDRMKLMHMIVTYCNIGGCYLDPAQLLKDECILAYGPLHDMVELRELEAGWLTLLDWPWNQPLDKIKNYFGEKIGLYFTWLGLYTTWLIPAALVGLITWAVIASYDGDPNAPSVPFFAGFMGLWSALFLENWKRVEHIKAMEWGTTGFEQEEQDRPQFQGEKIISPITGKVSLYFPRLKRFIMGTFTCSVVMVLVCIVILVIACIFAIRVAISNSGFTVGGYDISSIIASILISLQIQFLNSFFTDIAIRLNNSENHRTDTAYEDALISKTFCFQFVNSFASLFYIAFVKPYIPTLDACLNNDCMAELQDTLGTIFLTRLAVGNLTELGIPLVKSYLEESRRKGTTSSKKAVNGGQEGVELSSSVSGNNPNSSTFAQLSRNLERNMEEDDEDLLKAKTDLSEVERTYAMPVYDVMLGPFEDYAEMVIQFGYTTMFVAAFPLATVLSLVNNYVEIRVDAWKLCHLCRRPEPRSCEDIGTWYFIMETISYSSIFINSGLVAFTGSNAINYTWVERVWLFILMATGLFCIRVFVAYLVPDMPPYVEIQLQRQEYIVDKVVNNVEDEDDSEYSKNNFGMPNYFVNKTDDDPM